MAYRLRMPGQIGDWLAELAGSEPEAAAETGAALLVLMQADAVPGPPLVVSPENEQPDPRETLDVSYQQLLERLALLRQLVADAGAIRTSAETRAQRPDLDPAARAEAERDLAAARRREEELSTRSAVAQRRVDAFRSQKETAKALSTAAQARLRIQDAFAALGLDADNGDPASAERAVAESAARAQRVQAQADRALGRPDARDGDARDVLELQADPLGADIRVLFAQEPPGTFTLLTVLEGAEAVRRHRREAVEHAADLLDEIRADGWSLAAGDEGPAGLEFAGTAPFLSRFFPGTAADVAERAAALATAAPLAGLREQRGVGTAELAGRTGLSEEQILAAERASLTGTDLERVAAYVRGLGGTLNLTARFGSEQRRII